jgi:hypothetical protein
VGGVGGLLAPPDGGRLGRHARAPACRAGSAARLRVQAVTTHRRFAANMTGVGAACSQPGMGHVTSRDELDADAGRVRIRRSDACTSGSARASAPLQSGWRCGSLRATRACDAQDAAALPRGLTSNAGRGQSPSSSSRLGGKPRARSRSNKAKAARQTETWWFHPTYPRPS